MYYPVVASKYDSDLLFLHRVLRLSSVGVLATSSMSEAANGDGRGPSLTLVLLNSYYGKIEDLTSYLCARLELVHGDSDSVSEYLLKESDTPEYKSLVTTSYVALKPTGDDDSRTRPFKTYPPMMYMREVRFSRWSLVINS